MFKKLSFIILVVMLLVAGYFFLGKRDTPVFNYIKAVPLNAVFIIEFNNFGNLADDLNQNNSWKGLKDIPAFEEAKSEVLFIDSIISKHEICNAIVKRSPVVFSYHLSGKTDVDALGYFHVSQITDQKRLKDVLFGYGEHTAREYNKQKIYEVEFQKEGDAESLYFVFTNGLFLVSHSSLLIEEAIRQMHQDISFNEQKGFTKVKRTAGKNAKANIYVNYQSFSKLVNRYIDGKYREGAAFISNMAQWAELDLTIKKNVMLLNGFTFVDDSIPDYLEAFIAQKPQKFQAVDIFPSNTSMFVMLGISDLDYYFSSYKKYLARKGKLMQYENGIVEVNQSTGADIIQVMIDIFDAEMALVYTDVKNEPVENNLFSVIKTKSKSIALKHLEKIISNKAQAENKALGDYIHQYRIDKDLSYDIYEFPAPELMHEVFGGLFAENSSRFFAFIDNYLVFGHSVDAVSRFIYDNVLGKTLNRDMAYNELNNYLSSRANIYCYTQLTRAKTFILPFLEASFGNQYEQHAQNLHPIDALAVQMNASNDMIYNNIFFTNMSDIEQKTKTMWESALDTVVGGKPFFFTNHYTNEKEIFIQDQKNNIYLLNKAGRILWKVRLDESINSDVYQIDYYNNGKYQLLFSTLNQIHVIDREGNYVENFPVKLREASTSGISVFDYDNNKNYRIFVSCEDKHVYNYDKEGRIVKGWEFGQAETKVRTKIRHFRIGNKDYIVFADKYRVYILNRRGEQRVKVNGHIPVSKNNDFTLDLAKTEKEAKMAVTDTTGTVHFIYFDDGAIEELQFETFSAGHFFLYEDIDADGDKDFIFLDGKELKVFNKKKKLLFDYTFDKMIDHQPLYFYFSANDRKLGVLSEKDNKIFLFNGDGKLHEGFPLEGKTPFSVSKFEEDGSNYNLIVGNRTNFLYNYVINY